MYRRWRSDVRQEGATDFMHVKHTIHCISSSNRLRLLGYVCMYVNMTGNPLLFSELCNLKWQYSGCSMVCINKCFAPWKLKKRKTNTHRCLCTPGSNSPVWALSDTPSSGQRADECSTLCAGPHSLSWVPLLSVSTCMYVSGRCGWPVRKLRAKSRPLDVWASAPCTGLNYEHKGEFRDKRRRWRAPFLWLLLYIPIFWMCKPVHVVWKFLY